MSIIYKVEESFIISHEIDIYQPKIMNFIQIQPIKLIIFYNHQIIP